jgi:hypothetical protein
MTATSPRRPLALPLVPALAVMLAPALAPRPAAGAAGPLRDWAGRPGEALTSIPLSILVVPRRAITPSPGASS